MTFQEITARRLELTEELDNRTQAHPLTNLAPEWQRSYGLALRDTHRDESGVTYQRCGGGIRIIRKRIGGE